MGEVLKKRQSRLMSRRNAVQIIGGASLIAAVPFPLSVAQQLSGEHDGKKIYGYHPKNLHHRS